MKVHAHLLGESATVNRDGTFTLLRAGISRVYSPKWPALCRLGLATRLEMTVEEAATLHEMHLTVSMDGHGILLEARQPIAAKIKDVNAPVYINLIGDLTFPVPTAGTLTLSSLLDGQIGLPLLYVEAHTGTA